MDPITAVSLAASVIQLAEVAHRTFLTLFQYFDDVRTAPKRSRELRQELGILCDLLGMLEDALDSPSSTCTMRAMPESVGAVLSEFKTMLDTMDVRMKKHQPEGIRRLKWPFTKDENDRYLSRMERFKGTLNSLLTIKSVNGTQILIEDLLIKNRREILEWLYSGSFDSRHVSLQETRSRNCGQWFVKSKEFTQWIEGTGPACLLCAGIPGAGKSTLLSIAIDYIQNELTSKNINLIYLYFDYKSQETQTMTDILAHTLKQVLLQLNIMPTELERLYENYLKNKIRPSHDDLIRILTYCGEDVTIYGIFDALDECTEKFQKNTMELFATLEHHGYRILISTRPHLQGQLQNTLPNSVTFAIVANESDLTNYIIARLEEEGCENPVLKEKCLNLINDVQGIFLLAKFQLDHILHFREPRQQLKALETVPKDMSTAYADVVHRIERSRSGDKALAMRILSWMLRAERPLLMNELREALVLDKDDRDLERQYMLKPFQVIQCCKSLIVLESKSGVVRFTHYTVQEFLSGHMEKELVPRIDMAKLCLTYLSFEVFAERCYGGNAVYQRVLNYNLGPYLARYWGSHVRGEPEENDEIRGTVSILFSDEKRRNSLMQLERYEESRDLYVGETPTFMIFIATARLATERYRDVRQIPRVWDKAAITSLRDLVGNHPNDSFIHAALHDALSKQEVTMVIVTWRELAEKHPENVKICRALADALGKTENVAAISKLKELVGKHPNDLFIHTALADALTKWEVHVAIATWKELAEMQPENVGICRALANVLSKLADETVIAELEKLAEKHPDDLSIHKALAGALAKQGIQVSIGTWNKLMEKHPENEKIYRALANELSKTDDKVAIAGLKELLEKHPTDSFIYAALANVLSKQGAKVAIATWNELVKKWPENVKICQALADVLSKRDDEAAIAELKGLVDKYPDNLFIHTALTEVLAKGGVKVAITTWNDLMGKHPENMKICQALINALRITDDQTAIAELKSLARTYPGNTEICQAFADILSQSGDKAVITELKELVGSHPDNWKIGTALAMLSKQGVEAALIAWKDLVERHPENWQIRERLIDALHKQGTEAAIATWKELVEKHPENKWIREELVVLSKQGDEAAIVAWKELVEKHPGNMEICQALADALSIKRSETAIAELKELVDKNPENLRICTALANALKEREDEDTIAQLKELVEKYPENVKICTALAYALRNREDESAVTELKKLVEKHPENWQLRLILTRKEPKLDGLNATGPEESTWMFGSLAEWVEQNRRPGLRRAGVTRARRSGSLTQC